MKRKLLSAFLIMLVIIAAIPVTVHAVTTVGTEAVLKKYFDKGGDLKLSKSLSLTGGLVVPEGKKVTLDLNGKILDRGLTVCEEGGSVITVMPGATFILKDTSGTNSGILRGGAALNGGAVCNYGDMTFEGGTITGNKANDNTYGCGGAIYNGSTDTSVSTLTIKGGVILKNRSRNGAGIYNCNGCTVSVSEGSYTKSIGNIKKTVVDNVQIFENSAAGHGGAIYNSGIFYIADSPVIKDNTADDTNEDVFNSAGRYLELSGTLKSANKIILEGAGTNPVAVNKYNTYNTADAQTLFGCAGTDEAIVLGQNGEVIIKNTAETIVQVFSGNKQTKWNKYGSVEAAWNAAKAEANTSNRVEMILGSDWNKDDRFIVPNNVNMVIDLNGRSIVRARNGERKDDGEVIYVGDGATLTVKDSNPERISYDGIPGGVIAGGASGNGAGGVHVRPNATFNMYGGTIYKCTTDEDGGAILLKNGAKLNMKDCRIYYCQTIDSIDECNGGGIAAEKAGCTVNLDNVIFQDCYSEDSGGAVYLSDHDSGSKINCTIKNCLFTGNICEDFGGGLYIFGTAADSNYKVMNCTFRKNQAGEHGAAVYINGLNGPDKNPIILENCEMHKNSAVSNGGGVFVGRNGVVLMDCTITDNWSAVGGAVYVSQENTVSLAGKMLIKDNRSKYTVDANIELADTNSSKKDTMFESAGLIEGSEVHVYRLDDKSTISKHITQYQTKYIIPDGGTIEFNEEDTILTPVVTASLFGDGSLIVMASIAGAAMLALVIAVIFKKKRGGAENDNG